MNYILNIKKVHGPYLRPDGRKHVVVMLNDGKRKTVSYPKFLMEQKLGRPLGKDETVDHKDRDFTNDSFDNLQVLTRGENSAKSALRMKDYFCDCPICGINFKATNSQVKNTYLKDSAGPFCGKSCAGKYGKSLQMGEKELTKNPISVEYYRNDD